MNMLHLSHFVCLTNTKTCRGAPNKRPARCHLPILAGPACSVSMNVND